MNDLSQSRPIAGSAAGVLAPCPFCNGPAVTDFIEGASYVIKCSVCRTRSTYLASASAAIAAWNRRSVVSDAASASRVSDEDFAAIVKRYEDAGDQVNADIIRKQWEVVRAGAAAAISTWRQRIGVSADFPLHAASHVERAMVAEIAALRALAQTQDEPKAAGDAGQAHTCRSDEKVQALQDDRHMIVVGGQRLNKSSLLDLQRDAARYRWLRDKADGMVCTAAPMVASLDDAGRLIGLIDGDELDAAVDVAMATPAERKRKTKQMGNDK